MEFRAIMVLLELHGKRRKKPCLAYSTRGERAKSVQKKYKEGPGSLYIYARALGLQSGGSPAGGWPSGAAWLSQDG